jgi:DNA-binding transcriptional ArsR family regulator
MRMSEYDGSDAGTSPHDAPRDRRPGPLGEDQVDVAVEIFRMLAEATRVRILWLLTDHELAVGDLTAALDKPQALVSQHLAKLRLARLVATRRDGAHVFYRLANEHVRALVRDGLHHAEHAVPGVPAHHQS